MGSYFGNSLGRFKPAGASLLLPVVTRADVPI